MNGYYLGILENYVSIYLLKILDKLYKLSNEYNYIEYFLFL